MSLITATSAAPPTESWTDKFERIFKPPPPTPESDYGNANPHSQGTYPPGDLWRSVFFHTVKRELEAGANCGRRYLRIDYPGLDALSVYEYPSDYALTTEMAFGSVSDPEKHGMSVEQLLGVLKAKLFYVPSYACTSFAMGHIMHALVHSPAFIARSLRDAPADVPPPFTLTLDTQYPYMSSFRSEANCDSVLPLSVSSPGSTPASAPTLASGLFTAPAALEAHFLEADSRTDILRLSALALLRKHKFSTTRSCAVQADYDAELPSFSYSFVLESDSEASVANMLLPQEPGLLSVGLGVDAGNEAIAVDVSSEATAKAASETTLATSRDDASDTKIMVIEEPEDSEDFSGQFDDAEPSNETQESSFSTLDSFGPTTPFTQRILPAPSASASSIISLTPAWPKSPLLGSASTFSIRRSLDFAALYRSKAWLGRKRPTQDEPGPGSGKDAFRASGFSASFTR